MESQALNTETKEVATTSTSVTNPPAKSANTTPVENVTNPTTKQNATTSSAATVAEPRNIESDEETIRNQKLVEEFQYLLEKSQNLFSGLRDLPPTGSHRQWRPYFEKTFEVYTKLWKFQQTHRSVLENKINYGLKRWEVGEIASKIGQLYYHYYLRTSETNYLYESYVFYDAIHDRQYFKDILEVKNSALMIKKMRYYARFIIVCLLLNKDENVRQLITELESLIEEYTKIFKPHDAKEWQMVLEEIRTFTEAEKKLIPINLDRTQDKIEHRLPSFVSSNNTGSLKLQEAILVGNSSRQIKFSELTLDMYRMLQSLEREPFSAHPSKQKTAEAPEASKEEPSNTTAKATTEKSTTNTSTNNTTTAAAVSNIASSSTDKASKQSNPHKYLLYRPSLSQLLVYVSTAFKDTSDNSAMLLYLSADGLAYSDQTVVGYGGGVVLSQRSKHGSSTDPAIASTPNHLTVAPASTANTAAANNNTLVTSNNSSSTVSNANNANASSSTATQAADTTVIPPSVYCLHPADLIPYTRKPLFLIVDSDNSVQFKNMTNVFEQPLMCLMSPIEYPSSVQDKSEIGSLFTLFLHTPLLGFCSVSDIGNLDQQKWDECVKKISEMEKAIGNLLLTDTTVDKNVKRFMSDDFLYYFIVRFVLCGIFLRYHSSFKDEKSFPSSLPALPESVYTNSDLVTMLGDLTAIADVGTYFSLPAYVTSGTTASTASTVVASNPTPVPTTPNTAVPNTTTISASPPPLSTSDIP